LTDPHRTRFPESLANLVIWQGLETRDASQMHPFCVTLSGMGSKDKGKKEVKKAPKPKPKPEPGRKREGFSPAPPK
jgi:hypothetical protein